MSRFALTLLLLAVAVAGLQAQADFRAKHGWARWKVGSWVEMKLSSERGNPVISTQTLAKVGAQSYVLKQELRLNDRNITSNLAVPHAKGGWAHIMPKAQRIGEETLEVAGVKYPCTIWKTYWEVDGTKGEESVWVSSRCPLPLKLVSRTGKSWEKLVAVSPSEALTVGGKSLRCVKYKGKKSAAGNIDSVIAWRSLDIPGGLVKLEIHSKSGTGGVREATSFHGELN